MNKYLNRDQDVMQTKCVRVCTDKQFDLLVTLRFLVSFEL